MFTPSGCQVIAIIKLKDASSYNFLKESQRAGIKFRCQFRRDKFQREHFKEVQSSDYTVSAFLNTLI